jgi:mannose-6-phosphate isomerase-like protein (cupin superfamily)
VDVFGNTMEVRASGAETRGAFSLMSITVAPRGFAPLPHVHLQEDECFVVLSGELEFLVGDDVQTMGAGGTLHVPRGLLHQFRNPFDAEARMVFFHAPALDGFFEELGALAAQGPPDPATLQPLMTRWGMEVPAP